MPNFIEIGETTLMGEKGYNFFTPFNILAPQGAPWAKGHPPSGWWPYTNPLYSYLLNFVQFQLPLFDILLPNFSEFVAGVTHKNTHKTYSIGLRYVAVHPATITPNFRLRRACAYVAEAACFYSWSSVVVLSVSLSLVTTVYCGKMAESIEMPFDVAISWAQGSVC